MDIILVIAKYNRSHNATAEHRFGIVHTIEEAENWLKNINKPAMTYIDGMQNHDAFIPLCCAFNSLYWDEHRKETDIN